MKVPALGAAPSRIAPYLVIAVVAAGLLLVVGALFMGGARTAGAAPSFEPDLSFMKAVVSIEVLNRQTPSSAAPDASVPLLSANYGAGFHIDRDGHVVTAAHVVVQAVEIVVIALDGTRQAATLVGADELTDVAVLKVDVGVEHPIEFSPDHARLAETVIAVGSPFGLEGSISTGIVSGLDRARHVSSPNWFVQHSAAINPGNSGGPLLDEDGHLVGMNVALPDGQYSFSGIAFAVDASVIRPVAEQIMAFGSVTRAELGVLFRDMDMIMATALGREAGAGVVVDSVEPGGAAALAGLEADDIVLAAGGVPADDLSTLARTVAVTPAGAPIEFLVERDGRQHFMTIEPEAPRAVAETIATSAPAIDVGIILAASDTESCIASVEPASLAGAAKLEPGDCIHSINLEPIAGSADTQARLDALRGPAVLRVSRQDRASVLVVVGADQRNAPPIAGNSRGSVSAWL